MPDKHEPMINESNPDPLISVKQRIIQNEDFMNLHQQLLRAIIDGSIEQGEFNYWQENPDIDTVGLGLDPIGLKEGAETHKALANDLITSLFAVAAKEVEVALEQHFED